MSIFVEVSMRFLRFSLLIFTVLGLSACAHMGIKDNKGVQDVQAVHPMVVPPGIPVPEQQPYYVVPNEPVQQSHTAISLLPPGSRMSNHQK
jgi:uncharacterized lipoprotein